MLAGVFLLGWSALEAAVFVLVEAFLFLSLRAAAEITLEPRFGVMASTPARFAWEFFKHWLAAAFFIGLMVFVFGGVLVIPAFPDEEVAAFLAEDVRSPLFVGSLALLLGSLAVDTVRFARRVARGRSSGEMHRDDEGRRAALAVVLCLGLAGFWFGMAARMGLGTKVIALAVAGAVLFVEAAPGRATRLFQPPVPSGGS